MTTEVDPIVGRWYQNLENNQKFLVIEADEYKETVEIQYFDGDLDQIDLEEWFNMELDAIEPPEDWTGPVDEIEGDDLEYTGGEEEDWSGTRKGKRRRASREAPVGEEEEQDEWGERNSEEERWEGDD
jgi:hypothetical protein